MTGTASFLPVTPLIALHVASGLGAVVAGAGAMLATKGGMTHRRFGIAYLASLLVLVATGGTLAFEELAGRRHLLVLGLSALALGALGYVIRVRHRRGWMRRHLLGMGFSYIVMLTAFYVDNGPRLPVWWRLPVWALWLMPSLVGAPLLVRAWQRYGDGEMLRT
jgi:uncharacterized membrane protein